MIQVRKLALKGCSGGVYRFALAAYDGSRVTFVCVTFSCQEGGHHSDNPHYLSYAHTKWSQGMFFSHQTWTDSMDGVLHCLQSAAHKSQACEVSPANAAMQRQR